MERILGYDKKILIFYTSMLCILLLYSFIFFDRLKNDKHLIIGLLIILCVYISTIILNYLKYFNHRQLFIIFKYVKLFVLGVLFISDNLFMLIAVALCYLLIFVEIIFIYSDNEGNNKGKMLPLTFLPILISLIIYLIIQNEPEPLHFFFGIQFISILYAIYKIIDYNNSEMIKIIADQTQLWKKSQCDNQELLETQKTLNQITSEMYIQNELLRYISSTLDLEQLMDLVTDSIIGAIGVDTCSLIIRIQSKASENYYFRTKSNYPVDIESQLKEALEKGILDKYIKEKKSHIDSFVNVDHYPFIHNRPVGSLIIIPLIRNEKVYGLLISEHASTGFFGENNLQFFESIATQINIAVNNASLYTKMEEMATKDGLTGILNRRHLQKKLKDVFKSCKDSNESISVVLFDIDKFKNINDTYGHLFGDEAIKMVARIAQKYAEEKNGFTGRYGGEEFVMVLPKVSLNETIKMIEAMHEELRKEPLYYNKDRLVYINVSIGITAYPDFGSSAEDLLNRADNAMYYSKDHGRGRITVDALDLSD